MRLISTAMAGAMWSISIPDLIASTANNLKKDGWVSGQTWGYEVVLPQGFNFLLADRSQRADACGNGRSAGFKPRRRQAFPAPRRPRLSAGARGRAGARLSHAAEFPRDHEIQSGRSLCAGDRLSGRPRARRRALRSTVAPAERVLTRAERYELQELLARRGYDVGEPDGHLGGKTRSALRQFQASMGRAADGFASASILDRLRGQ